MYNTQVNKFLQKLKNHLIPHEGNNFEPHIAKREAFKFAVLLLIILELGFLVQMFVVFDKTKFLASVLPGVLTNMTNEKRTENQLASLTTNPLLVQAAQLKANDMAARGYFSHDTPDGKTPWYWLDQVGYTYQYAGENLAVNFVESKDVTEAWMNSPSHRANIVKGNYTEIGIAVSSGMYKGRESIFVVQFFGKPITKTRLSDIISITSTKPATTNTKPATTKTTKTKVVTPKPTEVKKEAPKQVSGQTAPVQEKKVVKKVPTDKVLGEDIENALTSPKSSLKTIYLVVGVLAMILLLSWLRFKNAPVKAILRSAFLIAVIVALVYINEKIFPVNTLTPTPSANSISIEK